jgi:hypothetical protein
MFQASLRGGHADRVVVVSPTVIGTSAPPVGGTDVACHDHVDHLVVVDFQPVVPTPDERELLLRFLHRQREEVVATLAGLSDAQARWTPDGRLLPLVGIINHLTRVEWRWIDGRYLGLPFPARSEEFVLDPTLSILEAVASYWSREARTEEVVRSAPALTAPCLGQEGEWPPAHILLGLREPIDLRWVLLHLIEETAHHAGHADATREMLDGTKMRP